MSLGLLESRSQFPGMDGGVELLGQMAALCLTCGGLSSSSPQWPHILCSASTARGSCLSASSWAPHPMPFLGLVILLGVK